MRELTARRTCGSGDIGIGELDALCCKPVECRCELRIDRFSGESLCRDHDEVLALELARHGIGVCRLNVCAVLG